MNFTAYSRLAANRVARPFPPHPRTNMRQLAAATAELAARPLEQQKRDLWRRHNALEPTRPVIFCDPENGWHEIFPDAALACTGELARLWEYRLRKEVFWGQEMGDDRVIEPVFDVAHIFTTSGWGFAVEKIGGEHGGSYVWDAPVKTRAELEKLHFPQIDVDAAATATLLALAQDTFDGLLTVRLRTAWWWTLGMTWTLVGLRGLNRLMYDLMDEPDLIHDLMAILRDGTLAVLDSLEARNLLSLNTDGTYVGSGGFGWTDQLPQPDFAGRVRTCDMWGFAESQETVGISPAMFEEFIFPYQLPLLARFGLNCYGCCEPLDRRWHVVQRFPRLRRVSVSPWADRPYMAEMLGDRYILSMKPHPADLAMAGFNEEHVRAVVRRDLRATRDCRVEMIMKDNHTIGNDPRRVVRWVQIAREEAEAL